LSSISPRQGQTAWLRVETPQPALLGRRPWRRQIFLGPVVG